MMSMKMRHQNRPFHVFGILGAFGLADNAKEGFRLHEKSVTLLVAVGRLLPQPLQSMNNFKASFSRPSFLLFLMPRRRTLDPIYGLHNA